MRIDILVQSQRPHPKTLSGLWVGVRIGKGELSSQARPASTRRERGRMRALTRGSNAEQHGRIGARTVGDDWWNGL